MIRIPILHPGLREAFPPVHSALDEPNGLLAAGGDLTPERLLEGYRHGIFPWFSDGEPILWWSSDRHGVPRQMRISRNVSVTGTTAADRATTTGWARHPKTTGRCRGDSLLAGVRA